MTLMQNLIRAEAAVKYAESHLRGRASNRPEDIAHSYQQELRNRYANKPWAQEAVLAELGNAWNAGHAMNALRTQRIIAINAARDGRNNAGLRLDSAAIIQSGIGNCFEHAVLACHYLNGIGVSSYIVATDDETDHVFVVLGLPAGLDGQTVEAPPNANPGPPLAAAFSVVCDPWYHEWFGIQAQWAVKMNRILMTTNTRDTGLLPAQVPFTFTSAALVT